MNNLAETNGLLVLFPEFQHEFKSENLQKYRGLILNGPTIEHAIVMSEIHMSFSVITGQEDVATFKALLELKDVEVLNASIPLYPTCTGDMCVYKNYVWGFLDSSGYVIIATKIGIVRNTRFQNTCYAINPFLRAKHKPKKHYYSNSLWKLGSNVFLTPMSNMGYMILPKGDNLLQLQSSPVPLISQGSMWFLEFIHSNQRETSHLNFKFEQYVKELRYSHAMEFFNVFYIMRNREVSTSSLASEMMEVSETNNKIKCYIKSKVGDKNSKKCIIN
jgi:hypothetical protein